MESEIRSVARKDRKTKKLVQRIKPGEIAVIDHPDIDRIAAEMLIKTRPRLVINAGDSISGRYPNPGPGLLLAAGIPVLDRVGEETFTVLPDGGEVVVKDDRIFFAGRLLGEGRLLTGALVEELVEKARLNLGSELENFVRNTLEYALKEKDIILGALPLPEVKTDFRKKQVLVVVRGENYREDLQAIGSYLREVRPVLVGVDGGADALLEAGFRPDLIIGDMDSVSDEALLCGAELVVHAYPDGRAPGMERLQQLGKEGVVFAAPGTSEDIALLLAYEKGASLIVAVGTHTHMIDFLEKGRKGMASTFLVRLKVGSALVDARGVSLLYRNAIKAWQLGLICLAAVIPLLAFFSLAYPGTGSGLVRLFWLRLRVFFGL